MDHIPLPSAPTHKPLSVQLYAYPEYWDQQPMLGYLQRIGWTMRDIMDGPESRRSREEIHTTLQKWTYFGILYEVLGNSVPYSNFCIQQGDQMILNTATLPELVNGWIIRELSQDAEQRRGDEENMSHWFLEMRKLYSDLHRRHPGFLEERFHLSVQLLYEYLAKAGNFAFAYDDIGIVTRDNHELGKRLFVMEGSFTIIRDRMQQDGWCPAEITRLSRILSVTECYYATLIEPAGRDKDHSRCNGEKCQAYQVDQSTYRTKHCQMDCSCEFVFARQSTLANILNEEDCVPIIYTDFPVREDDGRLYVHLGPSRQSNRSTRYVAISHIWSDGLGNNENNSIPLCQFKRISRLISALYDVGESPAFWFDTLCFPLGPPDAYDLALIRMRQSYEEADKVLVLDNYLLAASCDMMGMIEEFPLRLVCAPWNRRLWTLQEGVLAKSLMFQFKDGFIDLTAWFKAPRPNLTPLRQFTFFTTWKMLSDYRVMETRGRSTMNLLEAKMALTFRSTSNQEDEPLCLGNLLGLNPAPIVYAKSLDERMKVIWQSLPNHFSAPLFWRSPRLQENGLRWAPSTLMDETLTQLELSHAEKKEALSTQLVGSGLEVKLPGILFNAESLDLSKMFCLDCEQNHAYAAFRDKDPAYPLPPIPVSTATNNFVVLFSNHDSPFVGKRNDKPMPGLIADVLDSTEHQIRVQLLGRVRLFHLDTLFEILQERKSLQSSRGELGAQSNSSYVRTKLNLLPCKSLPDQSWLIG